MLERDDISEFSEVETCRHSSGAGVRRQTQHRPHVLSQEPTEMATTKKKKTAKKATKKKTAKKSPKAKKKAAKKSPKAKTAAKK
jgi:hypothetical protein